MAALVRETHAVYDTNNSTPLEMNWQ